MNRLGNVACDVEEPFVFNERFRVLAGEAHFHNMQLSFPPPLHSKPDGCYRTRFGPYVSHTAVIYANTNGNVAKALTRLTNARKNPLTDLPDLAWDKQLFKNQRSFHNSNTTFFAHLRDLYSTDFDFFDTFEEALEHHADPHVKKALRVQAWGEMHQNAAFFDPIWVKSITLKMKRNELAKCGKNPRMIGDLGVAASLQGFVITARMKHAMAANPIHILGGTLEFTSTPAPDALTRVFTNLINPPGRFYGAYFSDDSCFSIRHTVNGVESVHMFDVDIKQCDASHGPALFKTYEEIYPAHLRTQIRNLTAQCGIPFTLRSEDRLQSVTLKPTTKVLASGFTGTTSLNNLATISIHLAFAQAEFDGTTRCLELAAHKAGYMVTITRKDDWHDLQFLKHSPVSDTRGQLRAILNIGVLLRFTGVCNGDLPGRGDMVTRARHFQHALLRGAYPRTSFELLDRMVKSTGVTKPNQAAQRCVDALFEHKIDVTQYDESFEVDDTEVYRRYRLTQDEIIELNHGLGNAQALEIHRSPASDRILLVDYGLPIGPLIH